ncbi:hypothetical protein BIW11_08705 [Tropilaelaps mercedesae]|uniref:Uncharacterized protein n=1 Tax=Tropilaelaps mercedesae TaxID=418985 RepID=A0A1V9XNE0_9ACAR|nr:hypothetical protein BIW11_08705 [Tropilaelaps mercedesae]
MNFMIRRSDCSAVRNVVKSSKDHQRYPLIFLSTLMCGLSLAITAANGFTKNRT